MVEPVAERFARPVRGGSWRRGGWATRSRARRRSARWRAHDLRDELHQQVEASRRARARVLLGGEIPAGPGAFYPPTVLADVEPGMPAFDEETFGPVAAVIRARDEADAVALANDSQLRPGRRAS